MKDYEILNNIVQLAPNNLFLSYIVERIQDDNYRGIHCSQQNRWTYDYFNLLLRTIYDIAVDQKFAIHIGDDKGKKQPNVTLYYNIISTLKKEGVKGTVNSVKKNFFTDLVRTDFLYRYDKHGKRIEDKNRKNVRAFQLSPKGVSFATATEIDKRKYYTDFADALTHNTATELVELFTTDDRLDYLTLFEFMYILSDDRKNIHFNDKLLYLMEYRKLNISQQKQLDTLLKQYCDPDRNRGNKNTARDYHNWKNESQQIFGLLSNSTYFKVVNGQLMLNDSSYGFFVQKAQRKQKPKDAYFKYHHISKRAGYELHHIIPFNRAQNQSDAQWIDDERNLIYLSSEQHAKFTATQNINIRTSYAQPVLHFLPLNSIDQIIDINIDKSEALLAKDKIDEILEYNKRLLKKFYS